jgi:Uma2 family endonuclease
MDPVNAPAQMTAAAFLDLPADPTGRWLELIDGELVTNDPSWMHNGSQSCIFGTLWTWAREAPGRGRPGLPLDVRFDDRNVYKPDVVWYREGRVPHREDLRPYPVPDLVVEIRSPSTWRLDTGRKKTTYESYGVAELWLVDTAGQVVSVHRRARADAASFDVSLECRSGETLTSPLLPGFALAVGEIFELD